MAKAALNQPHTSIKGAIVFPPGFSYVSGDRVSGEKLKIRDRKTGSTYVWISAKEAIEKINRFKNLIDISIANLAKEDGNEEKLKQLNALRKFSAKEAEDLALRNGVFFKEGSQATFRM